MRPKCSTVRDDYSKPHKERIVIQLCRGHFLVIKVVDSIRCLYYHFVILGVGSLEELEVDFEPPSTQSFLKLRF